MNDERRFELPDDVALEDERAILMALERYFHQESPKPTTWVLQGRIETLGLGGLQVRRYAREPWHGQQTEFARKGVPSYAGRSDVG